VGKSIITVNFEIPGLSDKCVSLSSDQSLFDYDIIVFNPEISEFLTWQTESFQGKPSLNEHTSFRLRESASRWRQALRDAFDHGKTVFIFMPEVKDVYLFSRSESSGSGRNRLTTNFLDPFNNYSMLPLRFSELVSMRGKEMRPAKDLGPLTQYWAEFGPLSSYEVYFSCDALIPILVTRTGNKPVAGLIQSKAESAKGSLVLLPMLRYDQEDFVEVKGEESFWTKRGLAFGQKLIHSLTAIHGILRADRQKTPPPKWAASAAYRFPVERELETSITGVTIEIEKLQKKKLELHVQLAREQILRSLLYEKGAMLEEAILEALGLLELKANKFKDSESDFDVVFTWKNHRFLGEAEGKDNKAINIDKMSQLERNLSEDFRRDDVTAHAKGILFGNAFRLQEPSKRPDYFTDKCMTAAKRIGAALVRTPDLFYAVKYVKESGDTSYAQSCVQSMLRAEGSIVQFPAIPIAEQSIQTQKAEGISEP
jgi:hypothetical protein